VGPTVTLTGLSAATVTEGGAVEFSVGEPNRLWSFAGQQTGSSIFGRHTFFVGGVARVGAFTMTRTAR
jgi:hypothetical protein